MPQRMSVIWLYGAGLGGTMLFSEYFDIPAGKYYNDSTQNRLRFFMGGKASNEIKR